MAKRARVIIPFNYDEGWTGGNYYISNLVSSLNYVSADEQPEIYILSHNRASFEFIFETAAYPRLRHISSLMIGDIDGGLFRRLRILSKLLPRFAKKQIPYDAVFPFPIDTKERRKTICWIPDFQERALPHLFSEEELAYRKEQHLYYINNFDNILFSSNAARDDFKRYYPEAKNKLHVMPFAVGKVPDSVNHKSVLGRLGVPANFFYCPNQFWMHKNHIAVIEAVDILAKQGVNINVAFSGKELDRRDPAHVANLKKKVAELGLVDQIKFLGFISKEDQYVLIEAANAMLQPSLFEGWSTVVEEAKSKSKFIIASDITVHREQLSTNALFFDPHDPNSLAEAIKQRLQDHFENTEIDYDEHRRRFAQNFINIVASVSEGV
ncbi:glycosyltransferase family 4 protein [Ochrobactrum soli]|uniref:Glycosyl transferase, group 1 family protein n=1 Tax=Ochrobactrum soli TaxID=2448455 RepID=A0A2P9HL03_9HYPH|nr:glycosyltransferase family 1 protein [[Ochrobactrum] soli]SPL64776.1 Glycosyl transferase, group 1 family protein [[Ochrobactrum] soli]